MFDFFSKRSSLARNLLHAAAALSILIWLLGIVGVIAGFIVGLVLINLNLPLIGLIVMLASLAGGMILMASGLFFKAVAEPLEDSLMGALDRLGAGPTSEAEAAPSPTSSSMPGNSFFPGTGEEPAGQESEHTSDADSSTGPREGGNTFS